MKYIVEYTFYTSFWMKLGIVFLSRENLRTDYELNIF